jgi:GNAT superfamily N-acetyltransferase
MKFEIKTAASDSKEISELSRALHGDLELRYSKGSIEEFVEENKTMLIFFAAVDENNNAVACGALKDFAKDTAEIKRMYVKDEFRGKGLSKLILNKLEEKARGLNYNRIILETGLKQPEAMGLYEKYGYTKIPAYGRHKDDPDSVCYEKVITSPIKNN